MITLHKKTALTIKSPNLQLSHVAKKDKDADEVKRLKAEIKKYSDERKEVRNLSKAEMDKHAQLTVSNLMLMLKKFSLNTKTSSTLMKLLLSMDEAKARAEAEEKG